MTQTWYSPMPLAYGQLYVSTPAATTIGVAGTYYKTSGSTTLSSGATDADMPADNRLRYLGDIDCIFHVTANVTFTTAAGANKDVRVRIAKNGTSDAASEARTLSNGTDPACLTLGFLVALATNDYLEIFVTNATDTNDVQWDVGNIVIVGVPAA